MATWRKWVRGIFLCIGILSIFIMGHKIGWDAIADRLSHLSLLFIFLILVYPITWRSLQALGLYLLNVFPERKFFHFFKAQIVASSVGDLFPVGTVGGEVYRTLFLQKYYPKHISGIIGSVVIYNTFYGIAILFFFFSCISFLILNSSITLALKAPVVMFFSLYIFLLFLLLTVQKKGIFGLLARLLGKVKGFKKISDRLMENATEVDHFIGTFSKKHPFQLFLFVCVMFVCRFFGIGEVLLISYAIGHPFTLEQAMFLTLADNFVQVFLFFAPGGQIGVLEGTVNTAAKIIQQPLSVTMGLSLLKRIRMLFWDGIGMIFLATSHIKVKK